MLKVFLIIALAAALAFSPRVAGGEAPVSMPSNQEEPQQRESRPNMIGAFASKMAAADVVRSSQRAPGVDTTPELGQWQPVTGGPQRESCHPLRFGRLLPAHLPWRFYHESLSRIRGGMFGPFGCIIASLHGG